MCLGTTSRRSPPISDKVYTASALDAVIARFVRAAGIAAFVTRLTWCFT
jgi:hypothetical protein